MVSVVLDGSNRNADWIKLGQWDIPASSVDELHDYLGARGMSVEDFKQLPVYRYNQHRLKWLAALDQPTPEVT